MTKAKLILLNGKWYCTTPGVNGTGSGDTTIAAWLDMRAIHNKQKTTGQTLRR